MKIDFIKRGAETRLILIFAGWSTDVGFYCECISDGWDTAVVHDYRDLSFPDLPAQYTTIYVFAYSLGVRAAALLPIEAAVNIAVCGTPFPVSDEYGIPETIFKATTDNLSEKSLFKFHRRMAGGKNEWLGLTDKLPVNPDIEVLREELRFIERAIPEHVNERIWHRAYIAEDDAVIPAANQLRYWKSVPTAETVMLPGGHAVCMIDVIKACIPDRDAIRRGFRKATGLYNTNALVQADICGRIADVLHDLVNDSSLKSNSLLEIGAGQGLLTTRWAEFIKPKSSTYIDLCEMPVFNVADSEEYIIGDAEDAFRISDRKYDLILSASTIQWFTDPIGFLKSLRSRLNEGGVAVVSSYVKGNLAELDVLRPSPIIYHNEKEYLQSGADDCKVWSSSLDFASVRDMLMHLKGSGVSPVYDRSDKGRIPLSCYPLSLTYRPVLLVFRN